MVSWVYRLETSSLSTSGSAIIGSIIWSKSTTNSAVYLAFTSGASAGFSPERIWAILYSALSINPWRTCFSLSIPRSIMIWMRLLAIFNDSINVSLWEIQIEALAFISAVQSVKVKAWSASSVPMCTSIILPWKIFSPANFWSIWAWVAWTTSRKSIWSLNVPLKVTFTDWGIGIVASPVANASATVPEPAPKATPFDIRVCESPPIMTAQSSIVMSFNTLWITSVIGW